MPTFKTNIGVKNCEVHVQYRIVNGEFTRFYIDIPGHGGWESIAGYIDDETFRRLQEMAQIHHRELAINQNESEMKNPKYCFERLKNESHKV